MIKEDQFGKQLNIGDVVLFNNQDYKANFINYQYGCIVGFTKYFVVIKPDHPEQLYTYNNTRIYRTPSKLIVIEDYKTKYLYLAADFENFKKSSTKRIEEESNHKLNKFALEIIETLDDIERAILNMETESDKTGIENIRIKYLNILKNFGIVQMETNSNNGEYINFNPEYHEAIMIEKIDNIDPGKITKTLLNGYTINNKILRPAKVVVTS